MGKIAENQAFPTPEEPLNTISMPELYDTAYPPKMPVVDGLVYAGTYLFCGSTKVWKVLLYGIAWLPCQQGTAVVGLSCA
jgi:hypothetical protein